MKEFGTLFKSTTIILASWFITITCGSCVCLGTAYGWSSFLYQNDRDAIRVRYNECYQAINRDYASGYACMFPDYRQNHSIQEFIDNSPLGLEELQAEFVVTTNFGRNTAEVLPWGTGNDGWWVGNGYELVKVEGEWYFTGNYTFYQD